MKIVMSSVDLKGLFPENVRVVSARDYKLLTLPILHIEISLKIMDCTTHPVKQLYVKPEKLTVMMSQ